MIVKIIASLKVVLAQIVAFVLYKSNKVREIWLIGEKKTEARDNGYHFFKYMCKNHSKAEVYYVIKDNVPDYSKVETLGTVVRFDSFKHCVYFFLAKERVCSQLHGVQPYEQLAGLRRLFFWRRPNQHQTHLKHGIAKDLLDAYDYKKNTYDLLICGAIPEYNYYKTQFNYPLNRIALTGLCRFDALKEDNKTEGYILIMPTFREWLRTNDSSKNMASDEELIKFKHSQYFTEYATLLTNKNLNNLIDQHNLKIIFYLHYTFQPYCIAFDGLVGNDRVIIASRNDFDVQELLKHADMLITDYSSVYSDFAYLGRPLAYFQFDETEYRNKHYKQGYFEYRRDGFGPVLSNVNDVVDFIKESAINGFQLSGLYKERINNYFAFNDACNCKRVYDAIKNI